MKFISRDSIREANLNKESVCRFELPSGEMGAVPVKYTGSGASKGRIFDKDALARVKANFAAGEMMAPADLDKFIKQVIVDVTEGKNRYPTIYQEIYRTERDSNYPRSMKVKDWIGLKAAFGKVNLGESIPMAEFKTGILEYVEFVTEACGYSVMRDWVLFNELWNISNANAALGEAYNARMDNIHLSPILAATYGAGKTTSVVTGTTPFMTVWNTLRQGIKDCLKRRDPMSGYLLKPTLAFCNTATAMDVEAAIKGGLQDGSTLGELGQIQKVLSYDGWAGTVNGKEYNFPGPKDNEVYLIRPKAKFISFEKEGLTRLTQKGNILTLSDMDVAETFTMTLIADVENSVHKVTIA